MSLEKDAGYIVFECDGKSCFEVLRTETKDFNEAIEILNDEAWTTRKFNNKWVHVCPDCLETESGLAL